MHCFGPWPESRSLANIAVKVGAPTKLWPSWFACSLLWLVAFLGCVSWPGDQLRSGQSWDSEHSRLPASTMRICWHNKREALGLAAALHLSPMGTFWATLFFNIKCQINSEMWHQKSPRAITHFSVHCHLMWQTTAAAAVVQRIAWVTFFA